MIRCNSPLTRFGIAKLSQAPAKQGRVGFISSLSNQPNQPPTQEIFFFASNIAWNSILAQH